MGWFLGFACAFWYSPFLGGCVFVAWGLRAQSLLPAEISERRKRDCGLFLAPFRLHRPGGCFLIPALRSWLRFSHGSLLCFDSWSYRVFLSPLFFACGFRWFVIATHGPCQSRLPVRDYPYSCSMIVKKTIVLSYSKCILFRRHILVWVRVSTF